MLEDQNKNLGEITLAEPESFAAIADLATFTFRESWIEPGNESDIEEYIDSHFSPEVMERELAKDTILYYIIALKGESAGYIKLQKNDQPENYRLERPLAIHRIYIKKQFQNLKLGSQLIEFAISFAKENGFSNVWLGVWNENYGAIRFYEKYGFIRFGNYEFIMGNIVSDDYLMGLKL
jgi:ribosomal protein S18 acetylase RimI-like enzyme